MARGRSDPDAGGVVNRDALASYVRRVDDLHRMRKSLNGDITACYAEAKGAGFDTTILREIVRERQLEDEARHSRYALLDSYRSALGMFADTPLGAAAIERAESLPLAEAGAEPTVDRPRPFAEQPMHQPRGRGRPRRAGASVDDALGRARAHLGNGGTA